MTDGNRTTLRIPSSAVTKSYTPRVRRVDTRTYLILLRRYGAQWLIDRRIWRPL